VIECALYGERRDQIGLVPKIETEKGIQNLEQIVQKIQNRYIMFDKEDLYLDVDRDSEKFESLIERKVKSSGSKSSSSTA